MVHARIDVQRFSSVNQAKGRWALLDTLASAPGQPVSAAAADAHVAVTLRSAEPAVPAAKAAAQPGMSLEAVSKVVREAVVSILGTDPEGALVQTMS